MNIKIFLSLLSICACLLWSCKSDKKAVSNFNLSHPQDSDNVVVANFNKDSLIKVFADSINNIHETKIIPKFIYDECFDFNHGELWPNIHHPICVREKIINLVNNKASILYMIDNQIIDKFKKICHTSKLNSNNIFEIKNIPDNNKSFYVLLNEKYERLKKQIKQ